MGRQGNTPVSGAGVGVDTGRTFWSGSTGRWAGEQLLRALQEGREMSAQVLRTLDTLRKDEWVEFDEALTEAATIRLRGVADLRAAGLTRPVRGGLGKTVYQYEKVTDMNPAGVSMDGIVRTEGDRQEFSQANVPLPIIHKDFYINLRTLMASRERGESLDVTQVRTAGRLIAERQEQILFQGGPTFAGMPLYGYLTHPDRNVTAYSNGHWNDGVATGADILDDVLAMLAALEADRMYGPYMLYVPSLYSVPLEADFKAASDKTIRQRLLEIDRLQGVVVADQLTADRVVMVQMSADTVQLIEGEPLQTIQWDVEGGFQVNFKGFTISVPAIKSDAELHCGVCVIEP
jgi:uncharacterized linocin/CFP29 family protein